MTSNLEKGSIAWKKNNGRTYEDLMSYVKTMDDKYGFGFLLKPGDLVVFMGAGPRYMALHDAIAIDRTGSTSITFRE